MSILKRHRVLLSLALVTLGAEAPSPSFGAVVLMISPASTSVVRGGSVNLDVSLKSDTKNTVGLDYFLRSPASGIFTITNRALGSIYPDPTNANAVVTAAPSANLSNTRGAITGSNGSDLGASATGSEVGPGTYLVGTYTLSVSATAAPGNYSIVTYNDPGAGYAGGAADGFSSFNFDGQGSLALTVTAPEPSAAGLLGAGALGLLRRKRR